MKSTSLKIVREEAAKTIIALRDGTITPAVADAIYKQSLTIVDSYRVELRAIELALNTSTSPTTFTQAAKLVDKIEKTL